MRWGREGRRYCRFVGRSTRDGGARRIIAYRDLHCLSFQRTYGSVGNIPGYILFSYIRTACWFRVLTRNVFGNWLCEPRRGQSGRLHTSLCRRLQLFNPVCTVVDAVRKQSNRAGLTINCQQTARFQDTMRYSVFRMSHDARMRTTAFGLLPSNRR